MKKLISIALCAVMLLGVFCAMASCSKESYEIAVVTDVGRSTTRDSTRELGKALKPTPRKTTSPSSIISPQTARTQTIMTVLPQ